ncbi:NAD(P)-dependent oxidoreductase [Williamsia sp.]|uniref:NAD(P)-dependent oxidoreductase n=1 Tax=Williamsia sp. TaxID=1872085 RepID=UPI002F929272
MSTSQKRVAFVGLGNMGAQMSIRLLDAGYDVVGFDPADTARAALVAAGGTSAASAPEAVRGADHVILMLPSSRVVEAVLGDDAVLTALTPGAIVVDMSSSEPLSTVELAKAVEKAGAVLVDAPVSGGVAGAQAGKLTIMAGGGEESVAAIADLMAPMGVLTRVGDTGAGHALKSINNLMAAVGLLVTSEGVAIGRRFGLDQELMVSMLNSSSGQNAATDVKFPRFVIPETYNSGFRLELMLKDMRIATGLASAIGVPSPLGERAVEVWAHADKDLGPGADQTEIAKWTYAQ